MSKKSRTRSTNTFRIRLKASPVLTVVLTLLHLGALALLYPIDAPLWLRLVLAGLLLASLYRTLTQHALRSAASAIVELRWNDKDGLEFGLRNDDALRTATIRSRFVHRWLVLMAVQPAGNRFARPLAIAADALDGENFRRLRAALLSPPQTTAD